jgi:hypothetical protein
MKSGHRVIGSSGDRRIHESVGANNVHDVPTGNSNPVILSGAPRESLPQRADWRGVEGSLHFLVSPCGLKAFSREFPDASVVAHASSGSFDSPSPLLELAQDDSGREHRSQKTCFTGLKQLCAAFWIFLAALREIFDESAYERFLLRTHAARSVASYRDFLREREGALARKPRCC